MARRRKQESAAETLDKIEHTGDRIAAWIGANPAVVLGAAVGILVLAGGYGFVSAARDSARDEAAANLAQVEMEFARAMGGTFDDIEIPEPANPETGKRVRRDFVARYRQIAEEHAGTSTAELARLEIGALQLELGDTAAALETWQAAAAGADGDSPVRALLLERIAGVHERAGRWREAAEAYAGAAAVADYPLRFAALGHAARCYAEAGDIARALGAFDQLEAEAPDERLPEHVQSRLRELRARAQLDVQEG